MKAPLYDSSYAVRGCVLLAVLLMGCESVGSPTGIRYEFEGGYDQEQGGFRSIRLHWDEASNASTYQVQRASPDDGLDFELVQWSGRREVLDTGALLPGLFVPGHAYVYRIRGFRGVAGPWSDEIRVEAPAFLPPDDVTATYDEETHSVLVAWNEAELEPGGSYGVFRRDSESQQAVPIGEVHGHDTHPERDPFENPFQTDPLSFRDMETLPGRTYHYTVTAFTRDWGNSWPSEPAVIEIPQASPPVMHDASTGGTDAIIVRWNRARFGSLNASYRVYRSSTDPEDDDSYEPLGNFQSASNFQNGFVVHHDHQAEAGRWYHYKVEGRISDPREGIEGGIEGGIEAFTGRSENYVSGYLGPVEPGEPLPAPSALIAYAGHGGIALEWESVSTASSYVIEHLAHSGDVDPNLVETNLDAFEPIDEVDADYGSLQRYQDQQAEEGRLHYYVIRAANIDGPGEPSEVASAHHGTADYPPAPQVTASDSDYRDAIVVSWEDMGEGYWYQIHMVANDETTEWLSENEYVHFTEQASSFRVRAISDKGLEGQYSPTVWGNVEESAPAYPEP